MLDETEDYQILTRQAEKARNVTYFTVILAAFSLALNVVVVPLLFLQAQYLLADIQEENSFCQSKSRLFQRELARRRMELEREHKLNFSLMQEPQRIRRHTDGYRNVPIILNKAKAGVDNCVCRRGRPGVNGPPGDDGIPGPDGRPGADGQPGAPSPQPGPLKLDWCFDCPIAPAGPPGVTGPKGSLGRRGRDGDHGQDGQTGAAGDVGDAGPPGPPGLPGAPGERGMPGSIVDIDGPAGPPGPDGAPGPLGASGLRGVDGVPGAAGPPGPRGNAGVLGADGRPGAPGLPGPDGRPGTGSDCSHCPRPRTESGFIARDV